MAAAKLFFSLSAAAILAGCAVGPDYVRPEASMPDHFMGQSAIEQRNAAQTADLAQWWAGFGDPQLTRYVTLALEQNLDLAVAQSRVMQSRAALRYATAALLPSGSLSATAVYNHQSVKTPLGRLLDTVPDYDRNGEYYEGIVGASWEIDVFGGVRRAREAAQAEYQGSQAGVSAARLAVAAQTADTYVAIRGLQSRLAIARQQVQTSQRLADTVKLQFDKGLAAELQMKQAEGAVAQFAANVPVLETSLDAAMNALDVLLGAQPGTYRAELDAAAPIPAAPGLASAGSPAELLRRRPDLIVAERRLAASNARIGVSVAEYYPKVSIAGLVGTATTTAGTLFGNGASEAQGIFGLRWRLFDFGRVDAEIAAAKGANAEALAAYRLAVLRASEDVEDAFSAWNKREAQEKILAGGEAALSRARDASLAAYKSGTVSLIEVLDADSSLLQTRDVRAQAQVESASAAIASFRALGGGWEAPGSTAVAAVVTGPQRDASSP